MTARGSTLYLHVHLSCPWISLAASAGTPSSCCENGLSALSGGLWTPAIRRSGSGNRVSNPPRPRVLCTEHCGGSRSASLNSDISSFPRVCARRKNLLKSEHGSNTGPALSVTTHAARARAILKIGPAARERKAARHVPSHTRTSKTHRYTSDRHAECRHSPWTVLDPCSCTLLLPLRHQRPRRCHRSQGHGQYLQRPGVDHHDQLPALQGN